MRLLSLMFAAVCGGVGATYLLQSSAGSLMTLSTGPVLWTAALTEAEIGVGPWDASPPSVDAGSPPTNAAESSEGSWSHPIDDAEPPVREFGVSARLISNTTAAARNRIGSRTVSGWVVVANSIEGRPLHLRTVGTGSTKTLVVAGLDGEDRIAVNWIDQFVQQLTQAPDTLRDHQLVFLRAANPDGLTAKHLENARGVALNRNFPTANYRPGGNPSAGTGPASEPETRAVMQVLYDVRPQRVVHLVSSASSSEAICNGVAAEASSSLSLIEGLHIENFDPRRLPGSLEEFAATVLGIEVVTLRLGIGEDWRSAAVSNYPTFLAGSVPQANRGNFAQTTRQPVHHALEHPADSVSETSVAPVTRRRNSGYEELLPPPDKRGF